MEKKREFNNYFVNNKCWCCVSLYLQCDDTMTECTYYTHTHTHTHTHTVRDSEWQWHQLGRMQVCTSLQTMPVPHHSVFLQAGCPSCRPTNSVQALNAHINWKKSSLISLLQNNHAGHPGKLVSYWRTHNIKWMLIRQLNHERNEALLNFCPNILHINA